MRTLVLSLTLISIALPTVSFAAIELDGPLSPLDGRRVELPKNPTDLLNKAVNALPQSEEELDALGTKVKESLGTETGQKVRAVVKDIGRAFVWATELMIRGIKYLLNKL